LRHAGRIKRPLIDVCVLNTRPYARRALEEYRAHAAQPVEADVQAIQAKGMRVLATDLLRLHSRRAEQKIRHDPGALAAVAIELAEEGRQRTRKIAS